MGRHEERLRNTVQNSVTGGLNRCHQLNGDDRLALMCEFDEWLFEEWEDIEVRWLPSGDRENS